MELRLPLEMSPGREAACRAVFGTWGFSRTMHGKTAPSCGLHSQGGVRRGVRASGSYQEGTGKSGSYGMWNHPRGHVQEARELATDALVYRAARAHRALVPHVRLATRDGTPLLAPGPRGLELVLDDPWRQLPA